MPPKQAHGEEEVARETAGEFTAAAARARQPDHQAYVQAEHEAGLAGQGARVSAPATSPALLRLRLEVMCKSYSQTAGTDTTAAGHGRQPDHQACIQAKQAKLAKLARAQRCPPCNLFPPCLGMLLGGHARLYGSFPDQQVCWQINAAAARAPGSLTTRPMSRLSMRLVSMARVQWCVFLLPAPFPMLHGHLKAEQCVRLLTCRVDCVGVSRRPQAA